MKARHYPTVSRDQQPDSTTCWAGTTHKCFWRMPSDFPRTRPEHRHLRLGVGPQSSMRPPRSMGYPSHCDQHAIRQPIRPVDDNRCCVCTTRCGSGGMPHSCEARHCSRPDAVTASRIVHEFTPEHLLSAFLIGCSLPQHAVAWPARKCGLDYGNPDVEGSRPGEATFNNRNCRR
jgi:hypothetical protein